MKRLKSIKQIREAQLGTFMCNSDVVSKLQWCATFDSHTCIECAARDGKTWSNDVDHTPIGHSIPFHIPPLHRNCRCQLLPVVKEIPGLHLPPVTRASEIGPISGDISMADFIKMRGHAFADRLLGVGRADLFMSGKLSLEDMLDTRGKAMTLRDIKAKYGL